MAKAQGLGLMIWMIGLWAIAARFAWQGTRRTVATGWRTRAGAAAAAEATFAGALAPGRSSQDAAGLPGGVPVPAARLGP